MRPLALAVSLVLAPVVLACGSRTERTGSPGVISADGGASADAGATDDASSSGADASTRFDATTAPPEDGSAAEAMGCLLKASSYDQTCTADVQCVNVGQVLSCPPTVCARCETGTLNANAAPRYRADFARATSTVSEAGACDCPAEALPCCRGGTCQQCF